MPPTEQDLCGPRTRDMVCQEGPQEPLSSKVGPPRKLALLGEGRGHWALSIPPGVVGKRMQIISTTGKSLC